MAKTSKTEPKESALPHDKATICALVARLIAEGNVPAVVPGFTMWDPRILARWYATCAALSAMLTAELGPANVWKDILTSWTPSKGDDRQFHLAMLGTLDAIHDTLQCPQPGSPFVRPDGSTGDG
jgi:hypothetical protein